MILILSNAYFQTSMDDVIDWLIYLKKDFIRLNGINDYEVKRIYSNLDDDIIELTNNLIFNPKKIKSVWFYRWGHVSHVSEYKLSPEISDHETSIKKNIDSGRYIFSDYIMYKMSNANWLGHPNMSYLNKFTILNLAQKFNLKIPHSLITTDAKDIMKFKDRYGEIITKPLSELSQIEYQDEIYASFTSEVTVDADLEKWDMISPTLVQEKIDKKFEIRSFFMKDKFYSMAIFSQSDKETSTDFRKYNDEKPNRTIPFYLPAHIQNKLKKLFKTLNLNTGSIDIIYTKSKEFIFLEINPVGQYGMTSKPCNFYLEKLIAETL